MECPEICLLRHVACRLTLGARVFHPMHPGAGVCVLAVVVVTACVTDGSDCSTRVPGGIEADAPNEDATSAKQSVPGGAHAPLLGSDVDHIQTMASSEDEQSSDSDQEEHGDSDDEAGAETDYPSGEPPSDADDPSPIRASDTPGVFTKSPEQRRLVRSGAWIRPSDQEREHSSRSRSTAGRRSGERMTPAPTLPNEAPSVHCRGFLSSDINSGAVQPEQPLPPLGSASGRPDKNPLIDFAPEPTYEADRPPATQHRPPEPRTTTVYQERRDNTLSRKDADSRPGLPAGGWRTPPRVQAPPAPLGFELPHDVTPRVHRIHAPSGDDESNEPDGRLPMKQVGKDLFKNWTPKSDSTKQPPALEYPESPFHQVGSRQGHRLGDVFQPQLPRVTERSGPQPAASTPGVPGSPGAVSRVPELARSGSPSTSVRAATFRHQEQQDDDPQAVPQRLGLPIDTTPEFGRPAQQDEGPVEFPGKLPRVDPQPTFRPCGSQTPAAASQRPVASSSVEQSSPATKPSRALLLKVLAGLTLLSSAPAVRLARKKGLANPRPNRLASYWPVALAALPLGFIAGRYIGKKIRRLIRMPPMPLGDANRWRHTFPEKASAGLVAYYVAGVTILASTVAMWFLATWLTSFPRWPGVPFYPDRVAFVSY